MSRPRTRRWRRRVEPLTHGLVCPQCGATCQRHGRGGKRACLAAGGDTCPGLVCGCGKSHFVERAGELIWRRSPCPGAVCKHCGWTGAIWSIDFERTYGLSRCQGTANGCHNVRIVASQRFSEKPRRAWAADPITLGLQCPQCGASYGKHGRGGKRRCLDGDVDRCRGLVCNCEKSHFVERAGRLYWRRSPCPQATCKHCGWSGTLRSVDFERAYGLSRCQGAVSGCHDVHVVGDHRAYPGDLALRVYCQNCSCLGHVSIDPVDGILWFESEQALTAAKVVGNPGDLGLRIYCRSCKCVGHVSINPVDGISWVECPTHESEKDPHEQESL